MCEKVRCVINVRVLSVVRSGWSQRRVSALLQPLCPGRSASAVHGRISTELALRYNGLLNALPAEEFKLRRSVTAAERWSGGDVGDFADLTQTSVLRHGVLSWKHGVAPGRRWRNPF